MSANIDYYYVGASPFTYLGHRALAEMAARHGASVTIKPVNLMSIWGESGAVPPGQRPPVRQRYRLLELQRISAMRGLAINLQPRHFPVDFAIADSCIIAIQNAGGDAFDYAESVGRGVWVDEADISDEAEIAKRLDETGHDAAAILDAAKSEAVAAIRERNTQDAIESDAVGVPAYVLNGEVFWGQDRIEFLDHALASGRKPFTA